MSYLTCNICNQKVDGIAYRTSCFHLLCPSCSREAFEVGCRCPVCDTKLSITDVKELTIGVKDIGSNNGDFIDKTYQYVFQSTNWEDIINFHHNYCQDLSIATKFLFCQLKDQALSFKDNQKNFDIKVDRLQLQFVSLLFYIKLEN